MIPFLAYPYRCHVDIFPPFPSIYPEMARFADMFIDLHEYEKN